MRARDRYRRLRVTVDAGYTLIDLARVRLVQATRFADAVTVAGDARCRLPAIARIRAAWRAL